MNALTRLSLVTSTLCLTLMCQGQNDVQFPLLGEWVAGEVYESSAVAIASGNAYVAADFGGMVVVDVRDPVHPVLKGKHVIPGDQVQGVKIVGNLAYLACSKSGLQIVDVANPESPTLLGSVAVGRGYDVAVQGKWVYVAADSRLAIVDASIPTDPKSVGTLVGSESRVLSVALWNDRVIIPYNSSGLALVDVSNPELPIVKTTSFDMGAPAQRIAVEGDRVAVANGTGLRLFTIDGSGNWSSRGIFDPVIGERDGRSMGVALAGNLVLLSQTLEGVQFINVSDLDLPRRVGGYNSGFLVTASAIDDKKAYIADWQAGLRILDMQNSDGVAPVIVRQPEDVKVFSGATATLRVEASGAGTLGYQWYEGASADVATPVEGATTAILVTPPLTTSISYWVRVSNVFGEIDSRVAVVTVEKLPLESPQLAIRFSQVEIRWNSIAGLRYQGQYRLASGDGTWISFGEILTGSGSTEMLHADVPVDSPQRFYRVVVTAAAP